jgi:tetratricopeptide (TPR) repeat protein
MKNTIFLLAAMLLAACNNAPQPVANANTAASPEKSEKTQTVIAHTTENQTAPMPDSNTNTGKTKWTQSGQPIDTQTFDAEIASADKALKAKPADSTTKKALAEAYYNRAVALTDARQYASALGDYRRTLKYDPDNAQAKEWVNQIVSIYDSMGRESPPEGQEPPPLPFKKGEN